MNFKKFLLVHLQIYCVLVTLIYASSMIIGMIYVPEQNIKYYQLAGPFIIAAVCILPTFVTYFKTEPTLKQYIIRHMIQLAVIEATVLIMIQPPENTDQILFRVVIGAVVFVVYILVKLIIWLQKYHQSKQLTEQLKQFQKIHDS